LVQNAQVRVHEAGSPAPSDGPLRARPAHPDDDGFLLTLFAESRPELALLPEPARRQLIELQFHAQRSQYQLATPAATDWVLELDRKPVGRCYLLQEQDQHRLLDLTIAAEFRGHGLGSAVLGRLCSAADTAGAPLRLSVWQANAGAIRLYQRFDFVPDPAATDSVPAGYLALHRLPATGAA
jgi:GNAT superfamily N-acetyltransferase